MRPNDVIVRELLDAILKIVSQGSSYEYALMVLKRFIEGSAEAFPFAKYINISAGGIEVSEDINSVEPKLIGKFLRMMIKTLFSELFMLLVVKKLPEGLVKDLEYMGVNIKQLGQ